MASELFHDLLKQAMRFDCPYIHALYGLIRGLGPGAAPTTQRIKLAERLHNVGADFLDAMDEYTSKHCRRNRDIEMRCPHCGDPYCNGAVPSMRTPIGIVFLHAGSPPPEQNGK